MSRFGAIPLYTLRLPKKIRYSVDVFNDGTVYDSWGSDWSKATSEWFLHSFLESVKA